MDIVSHRRIVRKELARFVSAAIVARYNLRMPTAKAGNNPAAHGFRRPWCYRETRRGEGPSVKFHYTDAFALSIQRSMAYCSSLP